MNKDRGIKKWAPAAFMPEHTKMLHEMHYEETKVSEHLLDEHEWQEINAKMANAFEKRLPINLKLYFGGFKEWEGPVILKKIDIINNRIKIEFSDKTVKLIDFENIIGVEYE